METKRKYNTRQKYEILKCISDFGENHFTANDVVSRLKKNGNPVGQATVYRMIDNMAESGELRKYVIDGTTAACYQLLSRDEEHICREHFHLKCRNCGKLIHVECEELKKIAEHMKSEHGFTIDSSQTVFYGICSDCRKQLDAKKKDLRKK